MKLNSSEGFTLIELLVVIAIISLLSSVMLAALKDIKEKAQAKAFREEIYELRKALELYRLNNNNLPFNTSPAPKSISSCTNMPNPFCINDNTVKNFNDTLSGYITKFPKPPLTGMIVYRHETNPNGYCSGSANYIWIIAPKSDSKILNWFTDWTLKTYNSTYSSRCFPLEK